MVIFEKMKTVPLSKFLPELQFEFTDLPEQLFLWALLRTARTIAKDGNLIRHRIIVNTKPGVDKYALMHPMGYEINGILGVYVLTDCGPETVIRSFVPPAECYSCGCSSVWYDDEEHELHIKSVRAPARYFISLSVVPPDDASCELPAELYDKHLDLMLTGAKARILRLSNKPWTNLQLADAYEHALYGDLASANVEKHTHKMRGGVRMNFGRVLTR